MAGPETVMGQLLTRETVTISDYNLQVYNNQAILLAKSESSVPREPTLDIPVRQGTPIEWQSLFDKYPGKYTAGSSSLYLTQSNGTEVIGTVAISPLDPTILQVSWDADTLNTNTGIDSDGNLDTDPGYGTNNLRSSSPGTFDAIINPLTYNPEGPTAGTRYLIVEDIGNEANDQPAATWGSLVAMANDIIEFDGNNWYVIFNSTQESDTLIYQTNIYTGVQYVWNGVYWAKSFEGEYRAGEWRLEL